MSRNWEEFDDPGTPRIAELHASISPHGTVLISRNTFQALGCPSHVVMLWESSTETIGIRPVPPGTLNAFKVYDMGLSGAQRFHALRFITKYDLDLTFTVRFPTARIESGVLVLELANRIRSPRPVRPLPPRLGRKVKGQAEIDHASHETVRRNV